MQEPHMPLLIQKDKVKASIKKVEQWKANLLHYFQKSDFSKIKVENQNHRNKTAILRTQTEIVIIASYRIIWGLQVQKSSIFFPD